MGQILVIIFLVWFVFYLGRKYERNKDKKYNAHDDTFDQPLE